MVVYKKPHIDSGIVGLLGRMASAEAKNAKMIALFQFFDEYGDVMPCETAIAKLISGSLNKRATITI
jgi:hypothetical protein